MRSAFFSGAMRRHYFRIVRHLLRMQLHLYHCHPRNAATTAKVSMNPWAKMQTHRLRPDNT
jgi:hypothetical protein